jgi:four helix bundle protein
VAVKNVKELIVYKKAYELSMQIFHMTKRFQTEERFALTSQIRRSSRSVCMNLREVWAKRRYPAHFVSKLTDCDGENGETDTSLDYARDCQYITEALYGKLKQLNDEVGRMLGAMIAKPGGFLLTTDS